VLFMSFEYQIRPVFDSLTARLRGDLERHLESAVQELAEHARQAAQSAAEERDALLAAAVERATTEAREQAERALREQHEAQLSRADARHREEVDVARAQHRERVSQLEREHADALERLERQHREAMERLERRVVQLTDEHRLTLERIAREHEEQLDKAVADTQQRISSSLQVADLEAGARLAEAFRSIDAANSLSEILNTLADAVAHDAARSAIFLAGSASVRSWKAHGFSVNGGGVIEVPSAEAGIIQLALESREAASTAGDGGEDAGGTAPLFAALGDDRPAIAVPMIVNGELVAVVYADQGPSGDIDRASWPSVVEILARHASRALESITAHRLAQTLGSGATRPKTVPRPADVVSGRLKPDTTQVRLKPDTTSDTTREDPNAQAQLVARTLIAAIRAEHAAEVQAGLRERDLMTRLGGPISRAWAEYESKVPETIRSATNFFHAEMVRTLANGDASLLTPKS
jgi:hypothetical protein